MASTTFDFPHPFGPTIHVVPEPLNVTRVRSQNDLKPTISTFRSLSKFSPLTSYTSSHSQLHRRFQRNVVNAHEETASYTSRGGAFKRQVSPTNWNCPQTRWQDPFQRPSRLALLRMAVRKKTLARCPYRV